MEFIFTLTPGRSGTQYLADLLHENIDNSTVHHQLFSFENYGIDTPDVDHMGTFNWNGNLPFVQDFWKTKFDRMLQCKTHYYIETNHMLMKAGLVENSVELAKDHQVHFIILKRDILDTVLSFNRRLHLMVNVGTQWAWFLDRKYQRNILTTQDTQVPDITIWYIFEVLVRSYYYRLKYQHLPNVHFHEYNVEDLVYKTTVAKLLNSLHVNKTAEHVIIPEVGKTNHRERHEIDEINYISSVIKEYKILCDLNAIARQLHFNPRGGW